MRFWGSSKLDEIGWCWMHIQAWIWWQGILLQSQFSLFLCILKPEAYAQKLDRSKTPAQLHIMNWHPDLLYTIYTIYTYIIVYIYIYTHTYIYIYIYIYRERNPSLRYFLPGLHVGWLRAIGNPCHTKFVSDFRICLGHSDAKLADIRRTCFMCCPDLRRYEDIWSHWNPDMICHDVSWWLSFSFESLVLVAKEDSHHYLAELKASQSLSYQRFCSKKGCRMRHKSKHQGDLFTWNLCCNGFCMFLLKPEVPTGEILGDQNSYLHIFARAYSRLLF